MSSLLEHFKCTRQVDDYDNDVMTILNTAAAAAANTNTTFDFCLTFNIFAPSLQNKPYANMSKTAS